MDQLELKGGGPRTTTCPEPVEVIVVSDGGGEAVVENHHHRLPNHLHETYAVVVPSPFGFRTTASQAAYSARRSR